MSWADVLKFTPGWLSFLWLLVTGVHKVTVRRHRIRIGPADEVREALIDTRIALQTVLLEQPARAWYREDGRLDWVLRFEDLSRRIGDRDLSCSLQELVNIWSHLSGTAPRFQLSGRTQPTESQRRALASEAAKQDAQIWRASLLAGFTAVDEAIRRLDKLERKTVGR